MQDQSVYTVIKPQFPEQEQLKCPRCGSSNTKFCYYNNYNLSQPRHFCKNCRRYWTKGGALRNIPVGGVNRKNTKRSYNPKSPSSSASASATASTNSPSPPLLFPPSSSFDQDRQVLGIGGSFSSILESNAEYGNLLLEGLSPPSGTTVSVHLGGLTNQYSYSRSESDLIRTLNTQQQQVQLQLQLQNSSNSESPFCVEDNGDSSCWNGGNEWPDLSM